ncbi:unnamed protein product [Cylindrotheca closterium]|uniref:FAD-binding FR-type domain-containing protein n=1 Tax=Cylindrotheca closterium TaxID=2856 RepID=A0AAD2FSZ9_9STRA|nr:unnamed protein product [Cylindrotheca closterium]
MNHIQDQKLQSLLNTWKGSHVIDDDGSNIIIYKPKRKSKKSKQEPSQESHEDFSRRASRNAEMDHANHGYASLLPNASQQRRSLSPSMNNRPDEASASGPKKKKKKKRQSLPETQAIHQFSSEQNDKAQPVAFDPYNDDFDTGDRKLNQLNHFPNASSNQDHDQEQPSGYPELIPIKRKFTTYKMPVAPEPVQPMNANGNGKSNIGNNSKSLGCCGSLAYRMRSTNASLFRFKWLKLTQLLLATYIGILTFADMGPPGGLRDTETGLIMDKASPERTAKGLILVNGTERAIVAASLTQVACIGVARLSAWLMYPTLVMVFFTKFRATIGFLSTTPIGMYMHSDSHEVHVYCGWSILILASIHSLAHLVRWTEQGNLSLLFYHFSGLTGFFIISSCLLICIPMTLFRKRIKYEVRKFFHYLFIVFALALCFHTPTSAIPNGGFTFWVFGTLLVWYFLDFMFCQFFMTEKIETTKFSVLPSGVRVTMEVSERFQKIGAHGGICYICLPWVSKNQWHAFSLFENPENPAERQVFIQKTGDWTTKVHQILQRDTVRPAWIHGPFPSPYDNAIDYDNQILVASGIGITPALSVIRAHKNSRRINLIWAVRDPHLLGFFLRHLYLDHQGWNLIFYTGKEKLKSGLLESIANTNICIIEGRPKLDQVIPNIIFGIESGHGLPEWYNQDTRAVASEMLIDRLKHADRPEDVAFYAQELGFNLPADAAHTSFQISRSSEGCDIDSSRNSTSEFVMENLGIGFRPWEYHPGATRYIRNLDKKMVISTWGMLYCGGAKPVLNDLKRISDEYHIGLHVESFAW